MEGDALLALLRLTLNEDKVVADLAGMALKLAKGIRDAEARAEQAEAALESEKTRTESFAALFARDAPCVTQPNRQASRRSVEITRQTSVIVEFH